MPLVWTDSLDRIDWKELSELIRAAPLGDKAPDRLRTTFTNSMFRCFVFDEGVLVGAGRALADGIDCAYLCDVVILPSHQGRGLGREIIARLLDMARGHKKIILYAVPGKEGFYARLGFRRMRTAMAIFEDPQQAAAGGYLADD
jgi:GNAT superfamily N-acetyltransferase